MANLWNDEWCLTDDLIHLNHAAVGPWPKRTMEAVKQFAAENAQIGSWNYAKWLGIEIKLKQQIKTLINAKSPDEIALLKNTSEGLSFVAYGMHWSKGDNIVISAEEFPSNRIVWESLKPLGVEIRMADLQAGASPEESLMTCCDKNTKLLAISSVQYSSGIRVNLPLLGEFCVQSDIRFCVDAIQSIGAITTDVQAWHADFVVADAHKWMLAPEGIALFYCRHSLLETLKLHEFGWHMVEHVGDYDKMDWSPATSARRFECGSPNMLGIHAMSASLSLLLEIGMSEVEQRVLSNTEFLINALSANSNIHVTSPIAKDRHAGIVNFKHHIVSAENLYEKLKANNVLCAMRGGGVRFSPHYYTTQSKMELAIELCM